MPQINSITIKLVPKFTIQRTSITNLKKITVRINAIVPTPFRGKTFVSATIVKFNPVPNDSSMNVELESLATKIFDPRDHPDFNNVDYDFEFTRSELFGNSRRSKGFQVLVMAQVKYSTSDVRTVLFSDRKTLASAINSVNNR